MKQSLNILLQFMRRDFLVSKGIIVRHIINDNIIVPILFTLSFGYILPSVAGLQLSDDNSLGIFLGSILWSILGFVFVRSMDLCFDLQGNRFSEYQSMMLVPWMVIFEKILFLSLFSFFLFIPFYPVCFVLLGKLTLLLQMSWWQFLLILYIGSYMISALMIVEMVYVTGPDKLDDFWMRFLHVFAMLGGAMIPWHGMHVISPLLARAMYINPFIYLTEGVRQAIVGGDQFLSFGLCFSALLLFSAIFTILAVHYFKKKIDHI